MYVCICNAITDKQIRHAAEDGVRDLWQLQSTLGVATNCGSCKQHANEILGEFRGHDSDSLRKKAEPKIYRPSAA